MPLEVEEAVQDPTLATLRAAVPKPGFEVRADGTYALHFPDAGVSLYLDRLRREHGSLIGELAVESVARGARTVRGSTVSVGDLNLSSVQARAARAKLLAARAPIKGFDWLGAVEHLTIHVFEAEREGAPAVDLREVPLPAEERFHHVLGLALPQNSPAILFGDGGSLKSYLALFIAGTLARRGISTGYLDWELDGPTHRERLRRLFGADEPRVIYLRCDRPLVHDVDRIRRIVSAERLQYLIFDSVGFACDGPPEEAGTALAYFRADRQIGVGGLHIAHCSKQADSDKRPFGSIYWHNSARATWHVKPANENLPDGSTVDLMLTPRKANLGPQHTPIGLTVSFTSTSTEIKRFPLQDVPEFAEKLPVTLQITGLLRGGARTVTQIAAELNLPTNTVTQTVNRWLRKGKHFIELGGTGSARIIGLLDRDKCHDTP